MANVCPNFFIELHSEAIWKIRFSNELFQRTLSDLIYCRPKNRTSHDISYGSNVSFSAHVPIFIGVIVLRRLQGSGRLWIMSL